MVWHGLVDVQPPCLTISRNLTHRQCSLPCLIAPGVCIPSSGLLSNNHAVGVVGWVGLTPVLSKNMQRLPDPALTPQAADNSFCHAVTW